jgi:hypothetical protein
VIVAETRKGIEVHHIIDGRLVCSMPLEDHHRTVVHAEILGDDQIYRLETQCYHEPLKCVLSMYRVDDMSPWRSIFTLWESEDHTTETIASVAPLLIK